MTISVPIIIAFYFVAFPIGMWILVGFTILEHLFS